ncbi:Ferri-bacillibactin esterase BesA [Pigmentiphaga humi]|uniref:Ferri-bacillibactin esterase BesA n=1 Tax=Pigmentiphaga humi TaxID=2478468 RepID=A0A3P4B8A6_9BURK|nr:alpha/beta hydrolase-fold protein [Pigmentiphaga humi]VCU72463.1 Ferri-bacillibactin esterase BesA [Pigmentiphaga humi]
MPRALSFTETRRGRTVRLAGCLLLAGLAGAAGQAAAQPRPDLPLAEQPAAEAVGISAQRIDRFVLASPLRSTGYRIQVWQPLGPPPPGGYPVIYALDGNAMFESLVQAGLRQGTPQAAPVVIVGIGYDVDDRFNSDARAYDYTPPSPGADAPTGAPGDPAASRRARPGGGADIFLDFIERQLKPVIAARYPVDARRATLYGHSYGGLLTLHALFTRPGTFQSYVAASPSLWWNQRYILEEAREFARRHRQASPLRLLVMHGGSEPVDAADPERIDSLAAMLRTVPGLQVGLRTFPGLGHGPMLPASLGPAVRFAADAP